MLAYINLLEILWDYDVPWLLLGPCFQFSRLEWVVLDKSRKPIFHEVHQPCQEVAASKTRDIIELSKAAQKLLSCRLTPCERPCNAMVENCVRSCIHFCYRSLLAFGKVVWLAWRVVILEANVVPSLPALTEPPPPPPPPGRFSSRASISFCAWICSWSLAWKQRERLVKRFYFWFIILYSIMFI